MIERPAIAESDHAAVTQSCLERSSGASLAVETYWDVSVWNPYVVILAKTQLRAVAEAR